MACNVSTLFYRPYTAQNSSDSYMWLEGCGGITACAFSFLENEYYVGFDFVSSLGHDIDTDTFTPSKLGSIFNSSSYPADFTSFTNAIDFNGEGSGLYIYPFLTTDIMRVDRIEIDLYENGNKHTYTDGDGITVIQPSLTKDTSPEITDEIISELSQKYNTKYYDPLDKTWIANDYYFVPEENELQFINNHVINNVPQIDNDGYGYNKYSRYKITFDADLGIDKNAVTGVDVRVYLKYNDDLGDVDFDDNGTNVWIKLRTTFTGYDITNKKNLYNNMSLTCNNTDVCIKPYTRNRYISYYLRDLNLYGFTNGKYNPYIYLQILSNPPLNKYSFVGLYYNITSVEQSSDVNVDFESLTPIDVVPDEYGMYKFRFNSYREIGQTGDLYLNIYAIYNGTKVLKPLSQRKIRIIKAY